MPSVRATSPRPAAIDLQKLARQDPDAAEVGRALNTRELGGVDLDGKPGTLTADEFRRGQLALSKNQAAALRNPQVQAALGRLQTAFEVGPPTPAAGSAAVVAEAKALLRGTPVGTLLLTSFERQRGEVTVVSEAEFKRLTGASGPAATARRSPAGVPQVVVSEGFAQMGNPTVALVLAHEMTHALNEEIDARHSQQDPAEALVWAETVAAQVQARVALSLGVADAQRGGMALGQGGRVLSPQQTARLVRRDPFYSQVAGGLDAKREPPLRWDLREVQPASVRAHLLS